MSPRTVQRRRRTQVIPSPTMATVTPSLVANLRMQQRRSLGARASILTRQTPGPMAPKSIPCTPLSRYHVRPAPPRTLMPRGCSTCRRPCPSPRRRRVARHTEHRPGNAFPSVAMRTGTTLTIAGPGWVATYLTGGEITRDAKAPAARRARARCDCRRVRQTEACNVTGAPTPGGGPRAPWVAPKHRKCGNRATTTHPRRAVPAMTLASGPHAPRRRGSRAAEACTSLAAQAAIAGGAHGGAKASARAGGPRALAIATALAAPPTTAGGRHGGAKVRVRGDGRRAQSGTAAIA